MKRVTFMARCLILFIFFLPLAGTTQPEQPPAPLTLTEPPDFSVRMDDAEQPALPLVTHRGAHPHVREPLQSIRVGRPSSGESFDIEIPADATPAPLLLRIDGPVRGLNFTNQQGEPRGDITALAQFLTQNIDDDMTKAMRIYEYAVDNFQNWLPTGHRLATHGVSPYNLADSLWVDGHGFCEDFSYVLAALWQAAGLPARIVGIGGRHAQAEVFFDQDWRLFDPQHRTFWRHASGEILSASKLKTDPSHFYQNLDEFGLDPIAYPPVLFEKWFSDGDLTYSSPENRSWQTDLNIHLREGEYFELRFVGRPVHYRNPTWVQMLGTLPRERNPPFNIAAKQYYDPQRTKKEPELQQIPLNDGRIAHVLTMQSPYIFTDGWLRLPHLAGKAEVYIWTDDDFVAAGKPKMQGVDLSKWITGIKRFAVCIVPEELKDNSFQGLQLHTDLKIAPIGMPHLFPGSNQWPITWETGTPMIWLWYREHTPDLTVAHVGQEPEHPKNGEMTKIIYRITNKGSARSLPTPAVLSNPTTGLLMETVETVGTYTIPPLEPGDAIEIETWWLANTRMHWYGQNPFVQTLDFRIDPDRSLSDHDRDNHRVQHHIRMRHADGRRTNIPGYSQIGLK
jgi:hypothetical protein